MNRLFQTTFAIFVLAWGAGASAQTTAAHRSHPTTAKNDGQEAQPGLLEPDTDLIDVPTARILDYGGFSSRTRFFSSGGVLEWGSFGVFQRLNIGASLYADKLIGTQSPIRLENPNAQIKLRLYDGDRIFPAVALGYDGQGYFYNRPGIRYDQRQRGVYLVGSREIGLPGLEAHAGANISDLNSNAVFGTVAASYDIKDKVLVMAEWDNINNYIGSRFNAGCRVYVTPSFHLDFDVRGIGQGGAFSDGVSRGAERVVQFKYTGNF